MFRVPKRFWLPILFAAGATLFGILLIYQSPRDQNLGLAREFAQYAPLLSIQGSKPDKLAQAVSELAQIQEAYAALQSTEREKALMSSLYPIHFLSKLAETERARTSFVESGSAADWKRYQKNLEDAFDAYESDLNAFSRAFEEAVPPSARPYAVPEGQTTRERALEVLHALARGIKETRMRHEVRLSCIAGRMHECEPIEPEVPAPEHYSFTLPESTRESLALITDGKGREKPSLLIALEKSRCGADTPSPHAFALYEQGPLPVEFVGDLMFLSVGSLATSSATPYIERGFSYVPLVPSNFYTCPDLLEDYARIYGTKLAYETLQLSPRSYHGIPLMFEAEALSHAAAPLSRILAERTAGLDAYVEHIVQIRNTDKRVEAKGMPQTYSPDYLFRIKSAYVGLFLAHNPSVVGRNIPPLIANPHRDKTLRLWSELKERVSREEILKNLRIYAELQK